MTLPGRRARLPWGLRWLVARLPPDTRRVVARPFEETLATLLTEARGRGRVAWAATLLREGVSLMAWIARERRPRFAAADPSLEEVATMWGRELMDAFRTLARRPGVTVVCVATLALGVGANAAIFSAIDGVLLDNLAYAEPDRVVYLGETTAQGGYGSTSYENFRDWEQAGVLESVAALLGNSIAVTGEGAPERIRGLFVSASYFDVVGVAPVLGRAILPGEDVPDGARTAVLSHAWWQQRFGGDPGVIGRTLVLNNHPHTVVGVMPAGFRSPWDLPAAWVSLHTAPRSFDRGSRGLQAVIGRLADGQSLEQARTALAGVQAGLKERYPEANAGRDLWMVALGPYLAEGNRPLLAGLGGAVGLLLLIACANVANLQLARASVRRGEFALRAALGGGRGRLVRQLLVENALLFALGGAVGLGVAWLGVRGLLALLPAFGTYYDVTLDLPVALIALALALGTGVLFGLVPALEGTRAHPAGALREEGRGAGDGRSSTRFRAGLVVAQLALSVSLLIGAGLLLRSMRALVERDTGFDPAGLLTLEFRLPDNKYRTATEQTAFYDRMLAEVAEVPGVRSAALAQDLPFSGNGGTQPLILEGQPLELDVAPSVRLNRVSPTYLETMGMRVVRGRGLLASDRPETPTVALISETAAVRFFDGEDPLGQRFYYTEQLDVATIVGVVSDVRTSLRGEPEPYVYYAYPQHPSLFSSLAVRTGEDPMALADAVRDAVWRVDSDQPVWEIMPITERMAGSLSRQRFATVLLVAFAVTALLLASLGLFGVMAYSVRQRERELGVRLALGARPGGVLAMVLGRALRLAGVGLVVGVALALVLGRFLESLLFGVSAHDPVTYGLATVLLAAVVGAAALVPARRAVRVDPAASLAGR